jgi:hypothetical protein
MRSPSVRSPRSHWDDLSGHRPRAASSILGARPTRSRRRRSSAGHGHHPARAWRADVQQLANLLLLRGNIGRPGAGICPVRGHSNVQGDRTVGINERPPPEFLDRSSGCSASRRRASTAARGRVRSGDPRRRGARCWSRSAATSPSPRRIRGHACRDARCELVVGIHTKLNRSHLLHGGGGADPAGLARTEIDLQGRRVQSVTVEDSMSHGARFAGGFKPAPSTAVRAEPAIVAGIAAATLPKSRVPWRELAGDYDASAR